VIVLMRSRKIAFLALVVALVLGVASMAFGVETTPTLTASKTALVYPHSALFTSTVATPSLMFRRLAGASEWTTFAPVASGVTTRSVKPTATAAYMIVSDGIESNTVTITVAAQLSKPQINKRGRKWHKMTIKGWVAPMHRTGNVQLTFYRWEPVTTTVVTSHGKAKKTKFQWVKQGDSVDVSLSRLNSQRSKWSYKWTPTAKGTWKVVVSHEDVLHVYSQASAKTVIVKH
jgi:hypothetical protein